jgi:hypothetical protein
MKDKPIKFMYLRDIYKRPVGCVAIKVNDHLSCLKYQVSALHPYDAFNREVARSLTVGRLMYNPIYITCAPHSNAHTIITAVMEDIVKTRIMPTRVIKAAKLWLREKLNPINMNCLLDMVANYLSRADGDAYVSFIEQLNIRINNTNLPYRSDGYQPYFDTATSCSYTLKPKCQSVCE